jgi:hypothetical protein
MPDRQKKIYVATSKGGIAGEAAVLNLWTVSGSLLGDDLNFEHVKDGCISSRSSL